MRLVKLLASLFVLSFYTPIFAKNNEEYYYGPGKNETDTVRIHYFNKFMLAISASLVFAWPIFAHTSSRILFTSTREGSHAKLYVMDTDGKNVHRIGNLPGHHSRPQFSQDNRKILFTYAADILSSSQIYIMNADGSDPKALTSGPNSHSGAQFTWDGRIVYSCVPRRGPPYAILYIMNIDGSDKKLFSVEAPGLGKIGDLGSFSFGPGGMIVFTHYVMVSNFFLEQIFKISMNGTGFVRLTNSPETYRFPRWCSDGSRIAYVNAGVTQAFSLPRHQLDGIYVMNSDGSNAMRIVKVDFSRTIDKPTSFGIGPSQINIQLSREPSFSWECEMLTFSLNLDGKDQIYIVNADGTGMKRLTVPPSSNSEPVFSH